jgi:16S rRNA (cytidine1402-2'-O)-methyltransferase
MPLKTVPALYIVATPIGNLEDISLRAIRVLGQVKLIAAEDTRTTRNLLQEYKIKTKLTSYHEHNKHAKLGYLIELLKTDDIALVSDAGMPGVSDTGYELIKAAIEADIGVIVIPGASAVLTALVLSGLPANEFLYLGFLPRKKGDRVRVLESLETEKRTVVFFESPHRLIDSLEDIRSHSGDRKVAVCRELTKIHEEVFRGSVSEAIGHFTNPRGEFTIVLEGAGEVKDMSDGLAGEDLKNLMNKGLSARDAVSALAGSTGISKKKLYSQWLELKKGEVK